VFSSLRARLWLSYALMIAAALAVVAVVLLLYLISNPLIYRQTLSRVKTASDLIVQRPQEALRSRESGLLQRITQTLEVRVLVFSADLSLRVDTNADAAALPFPGRRLLRRAVPSVQDASGAHWLYSLEPLPDGAWLMVAAPRPSVAVWSVFTDELLAPMLQGGLVALAFSLILAFLIARWIADPLQRVVAAARGFPAEGVAALPERGPREVQDLTRAFNAMIARVQSGQRAQREFVANVSHELKTPLTSIQGFAQAILDGTADTPQSRSQAAQVIHAEAGRMQRMVVNLLDLARLDAGMMSFRMAPVDAAMLLGSIREKLQPQAEAAGVTLELRAADGLPQLTADGDRLAQVFTNLVDNAIKFTPRGGTVALGARAGGSEIHFEVRDSGPGIPAEALERVFDRFYQVDRSRAGGARHGAGLGLAIVQEIVQAHGGRISVRSQPGHGTAFSMVLPLAPPAETTLVRRKR
jgi:signal transduction histidine kinase